MNKTIILSLALIAAVGVIATGATISYFSDTETSTGNTFTAGTIDISIDGQNPWAGTFTLADMKPCYTDYINFRISNCFGADPNPVNIFKLITVANEETGVVTEPECIEQGGTWIPNTTGPNYGTCDINSNDDNNDLSSVIVYDLKVRVYDHNHNEIWYQTIYVDADGKSIDDVYGDSGFGGGLNEVYLGMIPAWGYMDVEQSYHLASTVTNWAQGDIMTFDIQIKGEQIKGTAVLEDKTGAPDYKLILNNDIKGTLTYKVKNPTFDFSFIGKVTQPNTNYTLLHAVDPWPQTGSVVLGTTTSDANGDVNFSGDLNTGDMKDAKVWLILSSDWNGTQMTGWHQADYLLETGLIWYEDTDL